MNYWGHLPAADRGCYKTLARALEQRFGALHQEHLYRAQLRARIRKANGTLPTLAQDIEKLAHYAYPNADATFRATMACDQLIYTLQDVSMQIAAMQARPIDLQLALAAALEFESIRHATGPASRNVPTEHGCCARQGQVTPQITTDQELLQKIMHRIERLETSSSSRGGRKHPGTPEPGERTTSSSDQGPCWNCNKMGHIQRNCRKPRSYVKKAKEFGKRMGADGEEQQSVTAKSSNLLRMRCRSGMDSV